MGRPIAHGDHLLVNRSLRLEFERVLDSLGWDIAFLQEVPPSWVLPLAGATGSEGRFAPTSRNWMRPVTAAIWERRPHLAGSWEGGGNMVLVRRTAGLTVGESTRRVLTRSPERRIVQFVGTSEGPALYNLHASTGKARSSRDVVRAAEFARETSGGLPYVLGGDFNCRPSRGSPFPELERRFGLASPPPGMAGSIDHLLVEGLEVLDEPRALDVQEREIRDPASGLLLRLSDHPPVVGTFGC